MSSPSSQHAPTFPFRPGLVRDQRHANQLLGKLLNLRHRPGDLDTTAFAAAAGMNLRLHDGDRRAKTPCRVEGLAGGEDHFAARDGNAEAREH